MPSVVEAFRICAAEVHYDRDKRRRWIENFDRAVNDILNEHRIGYELIEGHMVEFESKELHEAVVAPTLKLLSGRSAWGKVEQAYQAALKEISAGTAGNAITDAGSALQEALLVANCKGNSLGPLIKSAVSKGVFTGYDAKLAEWVSADRSMMGDAHKGASPAAREDAWLTVHIVGALILRMAAQRPRSS